jgi:hypothetical protein
MSMQTVVLGIILRDNHVFKIEMFVSSTKFHQIQLLSINATISRTLFVKK